MRKYLYIVAAVAVAAVLFAVAFLPRPGTAEQYAGKPSFTGTVTEVGGGTLLVALDEGEEERSSGETISVPLAMLEAKNIPQLTAGDRVTVYYDGTLLETDPVKLNWVYAITTAD